MHLHWNNNRVIYTATQAVRGRKNLLYSDLNMYQYASIYKLTPDSCPFIRLP